MSLNSSSSGDAMRSEQAVLSNSASGCGWRQRLLDEYVDCGTASWRFLERLIQGRFIDNPAAGLVDSEMRRFHNPVAGRQSGSFFLYPADNGWKKTKSDLAEQFVFEGDDFGHPAGRQGGGLHRVRTPERPSFQKTVDELDEGPRDAPKPTRQGPPTKLTSHELRRAPLQFACAPRGLAAKRDSTRPASRSGRFGDRTIDGRRSQW